MGKQTKIGLTVAAVLTVAGLAVFAFAMNACHWDFTNLSTVEYATKTYEISEAFRNISIRADVADITFLPAEDGKCKVVCRQTEQQRYQVAVSDGVLVVRQLNDQKWYEQIGIVAEAPSITLYLPDARYGRLTVEADTGAVEMRKNPGFESMDISATTGAIRLENAEVSDLALSASTGRVTVCDVRCKNLTAEIDTGDITLKNVIVEEVLVITADTGDIRFDGCDAGEIYGETDTGDITGTLLSEKLFLAETDTGKVRVPQTTTGGKCRVTTDTGNIELDIIG